MSCRCSRALRPRRGNPFALGNARELSLQSGLIRIDRWRRSLARLWRARRYRSSLKRHCCCATPGCGLQPGACDGTSGRRTSLRSVQALNSISFTNCLRVRRCPGLRRRHRRLPNRALTGRTADSLVDIAYFSRCIFLCDRTVASGNGRVRRNTAHINGYVYFPCFWPSVARLTAAFPGPFPASGPGRLDKLRLPERGTSS